MKDFKGKTALITGGCNGFGKEFVIQSAKRGMNVVCVDIEDKFAEVEKIARAEGCADFMAIKADVGLLEETQKVVKAVLDKYGSVELLINNAGIARFGDFFTTPLNEFQWQIDTNFSSHVYFMKQLLPLMREKGNDCHILNVCSQAGLIVTRGMPLYYATKHAAVTLAEAVRYELDALGITNIGVSVFCPGFIQTTLHEAASRRPERFQDPSDPYYGSEAEKASWAELEKEITGGLPIEGIGDMVFKGIEDDQFYILTHEHMMPLVTFQAEDRATKTNPTLKRLGGKAAEIIASLQK